MRRARRAKAPHDASTAPAFTDFIQRRDEWLFANLPAASAAYLHDLHPKDKQKALARRLGLAVADDYLAQVTLDEALEFMHLSPQGSFVLKPLAASSAAGVFCVVKEAGRFRDVKTGKLYSRDALRQEAQLGYAKRKRRDAWLVEELLLPADGSQRVIDDYKFFCFAGRADLILQKGEAVVDGKRKYGIRYYDREWRPVVTGLGSRLVVEQHAPPACAAQLLEVAERVATQLPIPFVRIDLYNSHRGPVLGEFTPGPGGTRQLNEEWTNRLTKCWLEAAAKVAAGLARGEIKPLFPEGHVDTTGRTPAAASVVTVEAGPPPQGASASATDPNRRVSEITGWS